MARNTEMVCNDSTHHGQIFVVDTELKFNKCPLGGGQIITVVEKRPAGDKTRQICFDCKAEHVVWWPL